MVTATAMMRITIHPLLLSVLLLMVLSGNIALYSTILVSLLWHEFGHLLAAYILKVRVKSCTILPYGGELIFEQQQLSHEKRLLIALGGPLATIIGMIVCHFSTTLLAESLYKIQFYLLLVNLLPIFPLDGGRVIYHFWQLVYKQHCKYESFLAWSLCLTLALILFCVFLLPKSFSVLLFSLFLFMKVIQQWRYRKYTLAYEKIVLNQLT